MICTQTKNDSSNNINFDYSRTQKFRELTKQTNHSIKPVHSKYNTFHRARFEVITAVLLRFESFGIYVRLIGTKLPTFRRRMQRPSSAPKKPKNDGGRQLLRNVGTYVLIVNPQYPRSRALTLKVICISREHITR